MRGLSVIVSSLIATAIWAVGASWAAEPASTPSDVVLQKYGDAKWAAQYAYDTRVPAAPALGLVADAPELSVSSLFGADMSKEIVLNGDKPGIAFAARPYWLQSGGRLITLDDYRKLKGPQALYSRTTISFAAAPKTTDDKTGLGAGFGISAELLKGADPRQNVTLEACLKQADGTYQTQIHDLNAKFSIDANALAAAKVAATSLIQSASVADLQGVDRNAAKAAISGALNVDQVENALPSLPLQTPFADWRKAEALKFETKAVVDIETAWKSANGECFKWAGLAAENSQSFQLAAGLAVANPDYAVADLKYAGSSVWAAYRLPLAAYDACRTVVSPAEGTCLPPQGALTAFAQFTSDSRVTLSGAEKKAAITQAGLVLSRKGRENTWNVGLSAVWVQRDFDDELIKTQDFTRYGFTLALKAKEGVWFEASFGETRGMPTDEESYGLVRITFK